MPGPENKPETKTSAPKSKSVSKLDIEKLKALNFKFTKSLAFKIILGGLVLSILVSSGYLAYLTFGQKAPGVSNVQIQQMETALLEAKKFANDSPIKAIKAIENYKTLPSILENRKNYILAQLYSEIDEPALAFLKLYDLDKDYLSKYTSYQRAKLAEKVGLEAVVVKELEYLAHKFPKEPSYPYELAKSYARQNLNEEAEKTFKSIQKLFPNTDYYLGADYYLANIAKDESEKLSRLKNYLMNSPEGSLAYLAADQLTSLEPDDTTLKNYKGLAYYSQGNYEKALEYFDLNLDSPELYLAGYAKTLVKLGYRTQAASALQQLLPDIKNKEKASELLELLISLRTKNEAAIGLQALSGNVQANIEDKVLWEIAKRTNVKEDYKKVYENYPDSHYAAESMAKVFWLEYQASNTREALDIYKTHWDKYDYANSHSFVAFWAGKIYLEKGEAEEARAVFQNLIIEHPVDYYSYRADQILKKQKDWYKLPGSNTFLSFPSWSWPGVHPDSEISKLYGKDVLELTKIDEYDFILDLAEKKEIKVEKDFQMWLEAKAGKYMQAIKTASSLIDKDTALDFKNIRFQYAYPLAYADIVSDEISENLRVDPVLAHALIRQESHYETDIVSKAGAIGLMQIMPYTARDIARTIGIKPPRPYDLMQPEVNIKLGVKYMEEVFRRFDNNMINAIASYNAGPGAVKGWERKFAEKDPDLYLEEIPYEETRGYVKHVLNNYWIYKQLYI